MKQWAYLLAVYAATMSTAFCVTGYITNPVVPAAQSAELEETVIENGVLVINAADYHDMRIGDGITPGGVRIYRTDALTEPPRSYPHGFTMNGNAISLNGSYDVGAEGPLFYVRAGGSNVLSVIALAEGVGATLSETYSSSNTLLVNLSVEDGASDPLVQYTTNLFAPAWTDCVYYVSRTGTNLIQIEMPVPDEDERGYYKITALSGYRARFGIPLEAPMVTATQFVLNGSAITEWPTGSSTDAVTAAGASNIAQNVLDASLADADTNSAASKQYVLDNAGGGGSSTKTIGGRATDWAWSSSTYAAPRTTNGVTYLEFPLDTTNLVNGVQLVGVDGIAVTQLIIRATASVGGGTIGLLSGFGTALTTNTITIPQFTTNSIQAVTVAHSLTGTTNGLFRWGVLPTNVVGSAAGVAWVEIFQARGAW